MGSTLPASKAHTKTVWKLKPPSIGHTLGRLAMELELVILTESYVCTCLLYLTVSYFMHKKMFDNHSVQFCYQVWINH